VADYVATLRDIAQHCEYDATLSDMLRDRLVCGVNHTLIQRHSFLQRRTSRTARPTVHLFLLRQRNEITQNLKNEKSVQPINYQLDMQAER